MVPTTLVVGICGFTQGNNVMFDWHVALLVRMYGMTVAKAKLRAWVDGPEQVHVLAAAYDGDRLWAR